MGIWEWVTAVLAIWGAASILAGLFWWLAGRRIFRKRPVKRQLVINTELSPEESAADVIAQFKKNWRDL